MKRITFKFDRSQQVYFIARTYAKDKKCRHCKSKYPVPDNFKIKEGRVCRQFASVSGLGTHKSYSFYNASGNNMDGRADEEMVFLDIEKAKVAVKKLREADKKSLRES